MHRILCSTGALIGRPNGRDWRLLSGCRDHLRFDGYEFMMYDTWYDQVDALSAFLASLALPVYTFHCEKRIGEAITLHGLEEETATRFEINCQLASFLHARLMVLHLWDGTASDSRMENNLAAYPALRALADRYGIALTVENVVCAYGDPLTHWRELIQIDPDVQFTWDTKMAAFHGQLDAMYRPENADLWPHIAHIHVNDYAGGLLDWPHLRTLHIGQGKIDFESLFAFLKQVGYAGDYTVEATSFLPDGEIHWDDLNRTGLRLRALETGE